MSLYHKYNNENILTRAVLAGLLDVLNNQIKYEQVWDDDDVETVQVPWFYNQSGDERFNQDFYTHYAECMPPRPVDGNFDMVPRGIVTYAGSSISSQRITSRYVQGRYVKEVDGRLETYVSYLYSIPLNIRINCELIVDRQITALKIEQAIREVFYKNITFYVYYKGMRVGNTVGFPDDITTEKNINYSFESDNKIRVLFDLEIETYQPVFDPTTEMKATSRVKTVNYNLYPVPEKSAINEISVITPNEGAIIPKGTPIWIEWSVKDRGKIVNRVNIQWSYYAQNERFDIQLMEPNHEYFLWNIPTSFTAYKEPELIWEENQYVSVSKRPLVKITPDLTSKMITSSSFQILDSGYFTTGLLDCSMNIQLEMKDDAGNVSYTPDGAIWANIQYNVASQIVVDPSVSIVFPGTVDFKHIDIYISNANDPDTFGVVNNIKIV